jgi:hypothetical protein
MSQIYTCFSGTVTSLPVLYRNTNIAPMRCIDPDIFLDTFPEVKPSPGVNDAIFTHWIYLILSVFGEAVHTNNVYSSVVSN